jgi:hypothetical protein
MTQHIDPQLTVLNYAQLEVKIFINVCALIVYNYIIPVYTVFIVYYLPVSVKKDDSQHSSGSLVSAKTEKNHIIIITIYKKNSYALSC